MTDLNKLNADYEAFIKAEKNYLDQITPEELDDEVKNATYAAMLMAIGIEPLNPEHHQQLMRGTQLGAAPLARVIMGRVKMTDNVAYRFQQATGVPMNMWLASRAVREETPAAQEIDAGQQTQ